MVTFDLLRDAVIAHDGEAVVGCSSLADDGTTTVVVSAERRREGIGGELLLATAGLARGRGLRDVLLVAPADDQATMHLLASLGLRGLARLSDGVLQVRVPLDQVRPLEPARELSPPA